jgi:3-hydroxyisobutyrate dehydrogenase
MTQTVTVLGTGTMGSGMARNLASSGFVLRVWNRTAEKAAPLADVGVVSGSPAEAVQGADVLVTMLWDAANVADVIAEAAPGLAPGTLWIQSSTVGVDGAAELADVASKHGLTYVDAPVLGTAGPARDGTLIVLASGPDDVRDRCAPVFDAIGSRTLWLGPAGQGSRLKLVCNAWVVTVMEGIAECLGMAQALGLDPSLFLEAVRGGAMDAPYVGMKGRAILSGDYTPMFTVSAVAKDAGLIVAAAQAAGADVGVIATAREHLDRAVRAGHGDLDMSATFLAHRHGEA